jgi:hypothetical protein
MKRIRTMFILLLVTATNSFAQISEGGVPPSFFNNNLRNTVAMKTMPRVNVDSLRSADEKDRNNNKPFRFGYAMKVNLNLENSGTWETLENGDKIWRLKIFSEDAYSINLIFDKFWLPENSQFFVYSEDRNMVLGAFTARVSNSEYNMFATDLIQGNTIVLEYYESAYSKEAIINIDKVIHAYKDMFGYEERGLGGSGSCNIDINCSQGNDWCLEKRAVSMVMVDDNTAFCSGCLINNVRQDLTPYFLTANHCYYNSSGIQTSNPATNIFRFHYWRPTCNGSGPSIYYSIAGATMMAHYAGSDFALLKLSSVNLAGFGILFAGWDRTTTPAQNSTTIHHPRGDAMKISCDIHPLVSVSWNGGPQSHWRAIFDQGIVQNGSSGAPLFNQNHKIVGQLHGNQNNKCVLTDNNCHCTQTPIGEYGRFDISWNGGGTASTRLKDWLDPDNTGVMSLEPTGPMTFLVNKTLTGTHRYTVVNDLYIAGNIQINNSCAPNNTPFTTEPGSNVVIKGKSISIAPGTSFKAGSTVSIVATNNPVECNYFIDGDHFFCFIIIFPRQNTFDNIENDTLIDENAIFMQKSLELAAEITEITDVNFNVFPNPSDGNFMVKITGKIQPYTIEIFNSLGGLLGNVNCNDEFVGINRNDLNAGVYYVKMTMGEKVIVKKIIIE